MEQLIGQARDHDPLLADVMRGWLADVDFARIQRLFAKTEEHAQ